MFDWQVVFLFSACWTKTDEDAPGAAKTSEHFFSCSDFAFHNKLSRPLSSVRYYDRFLFCVREFLLYQAMSQISL